MLEKLDGFSPAKCYRLFSRRGVDDDRGRGKCR